MKGLLVGIPVLNNLQGLRDLAGDLSKTFPPSQILLVGNSPEAVEAAIKVREAGWLYLPGKNLGVAGSWNWIAERAFSATSNYNHLLLLNDDVRLPPEVLPNIEEAIRRFPDRLIVHERHRFSCFILPRFIYQKIGKFDEGFHPAYYEDVDYLYRLRLADELACSFSGNVLHSPRTSERIDLKKKTGHQIREGAKRNYERYVMKWGGQPGYESRRTPNLL